MVSKIPDSSPLFVLQSHLCYLQSKNVSSGYFAIPLKKELLDSLKAARIEAIFKESVGVQIKTEDASQARHVFLLLNECKNVTVEFYKTPQQWYDISDRFYRNFLLDNEFEYAPPLYPAENYRSTFSPLKPDRILNGKLPGLGELILKTSPQILKKYSNYIEKFEIFSSFFEGYPVRDESRLAVDLGFRDLAKAVLEEFPPEIPTLYIVSTGHSIPIGAQFVSTYKIPCNTFLPHRSLCTGNLFRLMSQITSFGAEIQQSMPDPSCQSLAWLFDAHAAQKAEYDKDRLCEIAEVDGAVYGNLMPKAAELIERGIKKVVFIGEFSPQLDKQIESLKKEKGFAGCASYLEKLADQNFDVAIRGIDCRSDLSKVKEASF